MGPWSKMSFRTVAGAASALLNVGTITLESLCRENNPENLLLIYSAVNCLLTHVVPNCLPEFGIPEVCRKLPLNSRRYFQAQLKTE